MTDLPLFLEPGEEVDYVVPSGYPEYRQPCAEPSCGGRAGYMWMPFCQQCAWRMWIDMDEQASDKMKEAARAERDAARKRRDEISAARIIRATTDTVVKQRGWVYYLRVGDLIKIGFTVDMKRRLREYPPNTELLGAHRGSRQLEAEIHGRFIGSRAKGREWFNPTERLLEHIATEGGAFTTLRSILREEADEEKRAQKRRLAEYHASRPRDLFVR